MLNNCKFNLFCMSPILQNVSMLDLRTRDSAFILQGMTDKVTICALGHNLWVRDATMVQLTAEEGFERTLEYSLSTW